MKATFANRGALALMALVALAARPATAETGGSVSGIVVDARQNPVSGMSVRATDVVDPSKAYTAMTDSDGKFAIDGVPAGSYLVSAETVNTAWIQKDDSPIVEVSATALPDVRLVLVRTSDLAPTTATKSASAGGGGDALEWAQWGLLAGGLGWALVNLDGLEEDHDDEFQREFEIQQRLEDLRRQIQDLRRQLDQRFPVSPLR